MPQQIIRKDDGLWAVFSTVIDDFVLDDVEESEVITYFAERAVADAIHSTVIRMEQAKTRSLPVDRRDPTYEEACRTRDFQHFTSAACMDERHEQCVGKHCVEDDDPCRCDCHEADA